MESQGVWNREFGASSFSPWDWRSWVHGMENPMVGTPIVSGIGVRGG